MTFAILWIFIAIPLAVMSGCALKVKSLDGQGQICFSADSQSFDTIVIPEVKDAVPNQSRCLQSRD